MIHTTDPTDVCTHVCMHVYTNVDTLAGYNRVMDGEMKVLRCNIGVACICAIELLQTCKICSLQHQCTDISNHRASIDVACLQRACSNNTAFCSSRGGTPGASSVLRLAAASSPMWIRGTQGTANGMTDRIGSGFPRAARVRHELRR